MSEPQTHSTTVSEPHSGNLSVSEPELTIVMSEPQTRGEHQTAPAHP